MKTKIKALKQLFEVRTLRERALLLLVLLVLSYCVVQVILFDPLQLQIQSLQSQSNVLQTEHKVLDDQFKVLQADLNSRKQDNTLEQQKKLKDDLHRLNQQLGLYSGDLLAPEKMSALLHQALKQVNGVKLVSFKSLATQPLQGQGLGNNVVDVYKKGMQFQVSGEFFPILNYLQQLEKSKWHVLWDGLDYQVEKYPNAKVSVTIHTLSQGSGWIGIS